MQPTIREPSDQALVQQTQRGSRQAFGLLVVRYSRSVRALCLARLGLVGDLDDLVQEAFLRAFKGLNRLKEPERFGAYLHRIARNICVDWLRRKKRDNVSLDEVEMDPAVEGEDPLDIREERLASLRRQVGRLPLALREAVLMFYFERQTYEQIARFLGITEAAVNQRLHRARTTLRETLGVAAGGAGEGGSA